VQSVTCATPWSNSVMALGPRTGSEWPCERKSSRRRRRPGKASARRRSIGRININELVPRSGVVLAKVQESRATEAGGELPIAPRPAGPVVGNLFDHGTGRIRAPRGLSWKVVADRTAQRLEEKREQGAVEICIQRRTISHRDKIEAGDNQQNLMAGAAAP